MKVLNVSTTTRRRLSIYLLKVDVKADQVMSYESLKCSSEGGDRWAAAPHYHETPRRDDTDECVAASWVSAACRAWAAGGVHVQRVCVSRCQPEHAQHSLCATPSTAR